MEVSTHRGRLLQAPEVQVLMGAFSALFLSGNGSRGKATSSPRGQQPCVSPQLKMYMLPPHPQPFAKLSHSPIHKSKGCLALSPLRWKTQVATPHRPLPTFLAWSTLLPLSLILATILSTPPVPWVFLSPPHLCTVFSTSCLHPLPTLSLGCHLLLHETQSWGKGLLWIPRACLHSYHNSLGPCYFTSRTIFLMSCLASLQV